MAQLHDHPNFGEKKCDSTEMQPNVDGLSFDNVQLPRAAAANLAWPLDFSPGLAMSAPKLR